MREAPSNGNQSGIPWAKAKSFAVSQWMGEGGWLDDVEFQDPSHISKEKCMQLVYHWYQMDQEGTAFRLERFISGDGLKEAMYEAYGARWAADGSARQQHNHPDIENMDMESVKVDEGSKQKGKGRARS